MKPIIKATLLSGFTAPLWAAAILVVSLLFNWNALVLIKPVVFYYILSAYIDLNNMDPEAKMLLEAFFSYLPFLVFGMLGGFLISLFWNCVPKYITKDNIIISSLKHRTRSFGAYCLFIGESIFGIVALLSLPLYILSFIFPREELWTQGPPIQETVIKLALLVLVTTLSARFVWRCEVYIAKERQSAAQILPVEQQQHPLAVRVTAVFGISLVSALAIYMLVSVIVLTLPSLALIDDILQL